MKLVLAKWAADRVESGSLPEWVAQEAMNYLKQRVNGHGGMVLIDARGAHAALPELLDPLLFAMAHELSLLREPLQIDPLNDVSSTGCPVASSPTHL